MKSIISHFTSFKLRHWTINNRCQTALGSYKSPVNSRPPLPSSSFSVYNLAFRPVCSNIAANQSLTQIQHKHNKRSIYLIDHTIPTAKTLYLTQAHFLYSNSSIQGLNTLRSCQDDWQLNSPSGARAARCRNSQHRVELIVARSSKPNIREDRSGR